MGISKQGGISRAAIGEARISHGNGISESSAAAGGTEPQLQVISIRGHAPNQSYAGNASGRSDTRHDNRIRLYVGPDEVTGIRLAFSGMIINSGAVESALGNDYNIEAAIERSSPSDYEQLTFDGQNIGTVPDGGLLISDPCSFTLVNDELFYARTSVTIANSTLKMPRQVLGWTAGSGDFSSSNAEASSQVAGTGAMSNPAGGSTALRGTPPHMILGIPTTPCPAVAIFGDSIADGQGEQNGPSTLGSLGWIRRGLEDVNGVKIPYTAFSVGSNRLEYDTPENGASKRAVLQYFTHVVFALGTNDISSGKTLEQIQAYITAACNEFKSIMGATGQPLHVTLCKITPRSTSTDSWATIANQTVTSGYGAGSIRESLNAWLDTMVGVLFDQILDPNLYIEDQSNYGKWIVTGAANYATNDGVHPRQAAYILAAAAAQEWAEGLTV